MNKIYESKDSAQILHKHVDKLALLSLLNHNKSKYFRKS